VKSSGWRVAGGGESRGCSSGNGEEKDDAEAVEEKKSVEIHANQTATTQTTNTLRTIQWIYFGKANTILASLNYSRMSG